MHTLNHEFFNDPMEAASLIAVAFRAIGKSCKIFGCPWYSVTKETDDNASCVFTTYCDVHEDFLSHRRLAGLQQTSEWLYEVIFCHKWSAVILTIGWKNRLICSLLYGYNSNTHIQYCFKHRHASASTWNYIIQRTDISRLSKLLKE